jgi:hypothetical protein
MYQKGNWNKTKGVIIKRRSLDIILTTMGGLLALTLLIAGGLLMWGYSYTNSNVHDQLAAQQIYFPPASAFEHPQVGTEITPSMIPSVSQYAGQQLVTGEQARVYANDFIAVHLQNIGGGKTYSQLSQLSMADPSNTQLQQQVEVMFKGTTLRGLLLEAYGFSVMGTISLIAGIAAFSLAFLMLILVLLGYRHFRRTTEDVEFPATPKPVSEPEKDLVDVNA